MKKRKREIDLSQPVLMVWREPCATERPWRFSVWFNQRWFRFHEITFASKGRATLIARKTLEVLREKTKFKIL